MNITIAISASTAKRLAVLASTLAVLAAATVAYADHLPLFRDGKDGGEPLTAKALNDKFMELEGRAAATEVQAAALKGEVAALKVTMNGSASYANGAVFAKATAVMSNGDIAEGIGNGYAAAKKRCEDEVGPSAHMCTAEDLGRSQQLGLSIPMGWYSALTFHYMPNESSDGGKNGGGPVRDCFGWTKGKPGEGGYGPLWGDNPNAGPSEDLCSTPHRILCCDTKK